MAIVGALFVLFRRELLLTSFDPEFARTIGRNPLRYDGLLYALLGGSIALGVMNVGPLVVFGFLVLPALGALRIAPGIASAFAIAAAIAATSFLGGFALAYRGRSSRRPDGSRGRRGHLARDRNRRATRGRARIARGGCAAPRRVAPADRLRGGGPLGTRAPGPLTDVPRGSLPSLEASQTIAVLPIENATGQDLRLQNTNPFKDLGRLLGDDFGTPPATVMDSLQQRAVAELQRRGFAVVPLATVRQATPRRFPRRAVGRARRRVARVSVISRSMASCGASPSPTPDCCWSVSNSRCSTSEGREDRLATGRRRVRSRSVPRSRPRRSCSTRAAPSSPKPSATAETPQIARRSGRYPRQGGTWARARAVGFALAALRRWERPGRCAAAPAPSRPAVPCRRTRARSRSRSTARPRAGHGSARVCSRPIPSRRTRPTRRAQCPRAPALRAIDSRRIEFAPVPEPTALPFSSWVVAALATLLAQRPARLRATRRAGRALGARSALSHRARDHAAAASAGALPS